jgi:hypothetical protein
LNPWAKPRLKGYEGVEENTLKRDLGLERGETPGIRGIAGEKVARV